MNDRNKLTIDNGSTKWQYNASNIEINNGIVSFYNNVREERISCMIPEGTKITIEEFKKEYGYGVTFDKNERKFFTLEYVKNVDWKKELSSSSHIVVIEEALEDSVEANKLAEEYNKVRRW